MPRSRSSMRQIREVLRQKWELGFSTPRIACSCALSRSTVSNCLRRADVGGLTWPAVAQLDDTQLERRLFPPAPSPRMPRLEPDWAAVHRCPPLRRRHHFANSVAITPRGHRPHWFSTCSVGYALPPKARTSGFLILIVGKFSS